ncbi:putative F-box protein At3g10240 isoform X2 [Spinacia oleracea]|uniref:F-box protein At3g10240 isoform X2 n=1 Tax=Spinacia oleracea TaxID=3562 RepID=A0ABM3QKP1_SPIOL|nr:putative F-box protein At3g10240 isoform X2 [Spinacia oleracea]
MRGQKRKTPLPENKYLTPDLWNEVLLRSPVKTLLRFRCVCKSWFSLIDSPDFISMHLKMYKNNQLLAIEYAPKSLLDFAFIIRRSDTTIRKIAQLVKNSESPMISGSVMIDGLMLIGCFTLRGSHLNTRELSLWNPSIRKLMSIPCCPLQPKFYDVGYYLGFAPSSKDYKVVAYELGDSDAFELSIAIAIYSIRDRLWRVKSNWNNVPRWCFDLMKARNGVVFSQGVLYCKPYFRFLECLGVEEKTHLLSFDFDSEEFGVLKLPDIGEDMRRFLFLLGGSLAIFGISNVRASVWVMEKSPGKETWCQFSSGDSDIEAYEFFDLCSGKNLQFLYVENTGTLLVHNLSKLMFYDITSHQVRHKKHFHCSYPDTYRESLVLHKGYGGAIFNLTHIKGTLYHRMADSGDDRKWRSTELR